MNVQDRLKICQEIREKAAKSCFLALSKALNSKVKISELQFRNLWFSELSQFSEIEKGGWYDPPPLGFGILFGSEQNFERVNYPNLRPEKYWQRQDVFFDSEGLGYLFASPYSLIDTVPIIGDFGFTYYLGKTESIRDHYQKSYEVLLELIENIKLGMAFKELYRKSLEIIEKNDLKNYIFGITDKSVFDLGHTIPFIDRDPNSNERIEINSGKSEKMNRVISQARIFSNDQEDYIISGNCAFTFEPRLISVKDSTLPMFSFHTIIQFVNGKKIVLSNMQNIINLLNMQWIYE